MRLAVGLAVVGALLGVSGCGDEIGDSCTLDRDCSPDSSRGCDLPSPDGYCTIVGCDFGSCPDEAVCVSFFPSALTGEGRACTDDAGCTADEVCSLQSVCAPRSAEVRFCMKRCDGGGDCRDKYECRDRDLMVEHGGEPVRNPKKPDQERTKTRFCAAAEQT